MMVYKKSHQAIKNLPKERWNSKYTNVYLPSFEYLALILHKQFYVFILIFNILINYYSANSK